MEDKFENKYSKLSYEELMILALEDIIEDLNRYSAWNSDLIEHDVEIIKRHAKNIRLIIIGEEEE